MELSVSTFSCIILLNYVVLNHVLPQSDSNYADGFVVFIQTYASASAFVAC
jgi:hypothetical protein